MIFLTVNIHAKELACPPRSGDVVFSYEPRLRLVYIFGSTFQVQHWNAINLPKHHNIVSG